MTPSTPRLVAPDFSVTIAPSVAGSSAAPERTTTATKALSASGSTAPPPGLDVDHPVEQRPEQQPGQRRGQAKLDLECVAAHQQTCHQQAAQANRPISQQAQRDHQDGG